MQIPDEVFHMDSTACGKLFGFNSMYNAVCQSQLIRAFLKTVELQYILDREEKEERKK